MEIKRFIVGPLNTNTYYINYKNTNILIDPGFDDEELMEFLKGKSLDYIILTHYHIDHILGYHYIKKAIKGECKTLIHKLDFKFLNDPEVNGASFIGFELEKITDAQYFEGDEYILIPGCKILLSSGHTPGSVVVFFEDEKIMFSGDTIFKDGVGRTDLPGGDSKKLVHTLRKLLTLPLDTKIYPGHEEQTTLSREKYQLSHYCEI